MRQEGEPSVEEILDSIKKVIARDSRLARAANRGEGDDGQTTDESVLELDAEALAPETTPETTPGITEEPASRAAAGTNPRTVDDAPLTGAAPRASMQENFAALAMLAEPGREPQIVRTGETSLEGLTREMLRPMLAQWLDANLPDMVERLVKAEIARIAGKRD